MNSRMSQLRWSRNLENSFCALALLCFVSLQLSGVVWELILVKKLWQARIWACFCFLNNSFFISCQSSVWCFDNVSLLKSWTSANWVLSFLLDWWWIFSSWTEFYFTIYLAVLNISAGCGSSGWVKYVNFADETWDS